MRSRQLRLSKQLVKICGQIAKCIPHGTACSPLDQYRFAYIAKVASTLDAVALLHKNAIWEPAQSLIRVLLETRINFDYFEQLVQEDEKVAVRRVADAMMLDKIKQARCSEFFGFSSQMRRKIEAKFSKLELTIRSAYTPNEFENLKKNGFSGLSIEARAHKTGHIETYSVIYRNFSRNVHATDYVEYLLGDKNYKSKRNKTYLESRNSIAISVALMSAGGIASQLNQIYACGKTRGLRKIAILAE